MLREAVRLRGPVAGKAELTGARAALSQASDYFLLWELGGSPVDLIRGIGVLVRESQRDARDPDPLVLLARQVEIHD